YYLNKPKITLTKRTLRLRSVHRFTPQGRPNKGNHYAYRIVKLEMVIVPLKVHYKSTLPSNNPKAVMEKRFTVVKTTRVVSLSDLKTLSFPLTELFYES
ncbi:MAG TPA: hypothetical protein DGO89_23025, partial [Microcoleaceae bacterium UBA9251]|nr:hypothetical protein [Microcoleaceae cyanobacterium UBA9251]